MRGTIVLPPDAPAAQAQRVTVEVHDVSYADAPSKVLGGLTMRRVRLQPGARVPFELQVPEVAASHSLSLRCHVDLAGSGAITSGDLLSTQSLPVPPSGDAGPIDVPVRVI